MYAKTLMSGPSRDIPFLMATTDEPDVCPQLRALGWSRLGETPAAPAGRLRISPSRLQLVVDDQIVIDDLNPVSPPGWWNAIDDLGGGCSVLVLRRRDADMHQPDLIDRLRDLMDTDRAVFAVLPVTTPADLLEQEL